MAKKLSIEREREFQELFNFLEFYFVHVKPVNGGGQPSMSDVAADIIQKHGESKALAGLRMAIGDTIEELRDAPADGITALDAALAARGLVTFSELRRRYSRAFKRVVESGRVKNDAEYHLLQGVVVDQSSDVTDAERSELQALLDAYERRKSGMS